VSTRGRRRAVVGVIACTVTALGGCAAVSDRAQNSSLAALATQEPAPGPGLRALAPTRACLAHPYESLAPSELPPPGHMPAGTFMREIQQRGHLVVGVDQNSLGLGYFNPVTGDMEGFDISMVREIARAIFGTPDRIVYKAISTGQRESAVFNADVDIVASAFSINCERRRHVLFSSVYYRARQKLLVAENSRVSRLSDPDLRGRKVCATKDSTSIRRLAGTGVVPAPVTLRSDCLVALQEGEVAAITADDTILAGFQRQDKQAVIVGECLNIERYGMAMNRRHPEFARFVNAVLARLRREGKVTAFRKRWLPGLTAPTRAEVSRCDRR
jgi:polar amino acid transport system substrate-binding protein